LAGPSPQLPSGPVTTIVLLQNMVKESELNDDEEFKDIVSDVKEECSKFGAVEKVVIPRPASESKVEDPEGPRVGVGVGRIFVKFKDTDASQKAYTTLNGRLFNENVVRANFYSETDFNNKMYTS